MLTPSLRALVQSAAQHAEQFHDGRDHTVAAALLTRSQQTILGLNAYHFLGGPCAEVTALANHAATSPEDPVVAVVAVHGPTGQVISPCGKCRQVLFDLDPAIECVIRSSNGLESQPVSHLLPHAYDWRLAEARQQIYMWEGYESAIRDGSKRQTIRIDDPFRVGPADLVFERDDGDVVTMAASVVSVVPVRRRELTDEQAVRDGFDSLGELNAALDRHYPGLSGDDLTDVVTFELVSQP